MEDSEAFKYLRTALKRDWRFTTAVLVPLGTFLPSSRVAACAARGVLGGRAHLDWQLSKLGRSA